MVYGRFKAEYMSLYDKYDVAVHKNVQKSVSKKIWMTQGLPVSCKRKKITFKIDKTPTDANIINYKNYRKKFKTLQINMERKYYERENAKHNMQDSRDVNPCPCPGP